MIGSHGLVQMAASGGAPCFLPHDSPSGLFPPLPHLPHKRGEGGPPPYSRGVHLGLPSFVGTLEAGEVGLADKDDWLAA